MQVRRALLMGLVVCGWLSAAQAGWVIEQSSVATKPKGEPGPAEPATMRVSQGRIRVSQPNSTMVKDCVKGRLMIMVPDRNVYWAGTLDEYVAEIEAEHAKGAAGQAPTSSEAVKKGAQPARKATPKSTNEEATLPKIVVRKTDEQAKLAGYDTVKYAVESNGRLFQEVWLTTAFNLNSDLDPKKYLACEAKTGAAMRGASADDLKALYRSPDYLALISSGFAMKTIVHHLAGSYTREVRSVSREDISDGDFATPMSAEKVPLADLFAQPR